MHFLYTFYHYAVMLAVVGGIEFSRYALVAGVVSLLFYVMLRRWFLSRKIIAKFPRWGDVWREVALSMMTCLMYAIVTLLTALFIRAGWTPFYFRLSEHGMVWFWTSIVLTILLHDAYFYWTHRVMHQRRVFRFMHRAHHISTNPSPWAAYAFDPFEATVQAGIFPLAVFLIPLHPLAFVIFMIWQVGYNVMIHSGYEVYPSWLMTSWWGKLINTPTNHVMHHQYIRGNYGLYLNLWDRWMGTNHKKYEERFALVTGGVPRQSAPEEAPLAVAE